MKSLSKKDVIWSYLGQISNLSVHVILTPVIAVMLPAGEIGLWYTFTSIYTLLTFFDTSFSPLILKNAAYCMCGAKQLFHEGFGEIADGNPNYGLLQALIQASQTLYKYTALLFLGILLLLGSPYILYITRASFSNTYLIAWIIYSLGIGINFYTIYLPSAIRGMGYISNAQKIFVISRSIQLLISVCGILLGGGIMALAGGFFAGSVLIYILSHKTLGKLGIFKNNIREAGQYDKKNILKIIWFNAKKMIFVSLGRYFATQGGILVCSTYISLEMSGSYGLTMQALQALASISNIYLQAMVPGMSSAAARNDKKTCKTLFAAGISAYWLLYPLAILAAGLLCNPLLRLIGAKTFLLDTGPFFIVATGYFFLSNFVNFNLVLESNNNIPHAGAEFLFGILNLLFSAVFIKVFDSGIWGLIIMQTVLPLCYNDWIWPRRVLKLLDTNLIEIIKTGYRNMTKVFSKIN